MAPSDTSSRRPGGAPSVTRGQMRSTTTKAQQDLKKASPDQNYGLGIAKVTNLDYEGHLATLRTVAGASGTYERVPVPLTFPGAGARHFLGAMPQIGDFCIIGWMVQESATSDVGESTKTPVILGWMVPGIWPGRNWVTTAETTADEYELGPGEEKFWEGSYDRTRHKLRHIQPGNIVGSSAQGSDLVLDESVTLSNRRGNEFRLRDQDQAAVLRALQSFQALAGARVYAGMVQRDATFLPPTMVSDGKIWDDGLQAGLGRPLTDKSLPSSLSETQGFLTPSANLAKSTEDSTLTRSYLAPDPYLDPLQFLRYGGFINEFGQVVDDKHKTDAIYGAKSLFRVSNQSKGNAVTNPDARTLTEYRIEVTHTSDGILPVTEQTDMLDVDRIPENDPKTGSTTPNVNAPYIEWVLGSVVGNDPFSIAGRKSYGLPLVASVFDGDTPAPGIEPANITFVGGGASSTPILEQAATLFRLTPPTGGVSETFVSYNKQGQLRASIGGDPKGNAVEAFLRGGLKLGVAGKFQLLLDGHTEFGTTGTNSLAFTAQEGSVRIFGGGPIKSHEAEMEAVLGTGRGAGDVPAVDIEARTNLRLLAGKKVLIHGHQTEVSATSVQITGHEDLSLDGVKRTSISSENFQITVGGKCQESYGGPKYGLPTNFPLHERTYAPTVPGFVCEKVTYVAGDREETFNLGNHKTSIKVGNMTYETLVGVWKAKAATSTLTMSPAGINATASVGPLSLTASAGTATMTGTAAAFLVATAGVATVRGSSGVLLAGPIFGTDSGPILCAGSLEPFTGLPFGTWGIGAKGHLIAS